MNDGPFFWCSHQHLYAATLHHIPPCLHPFYLLPSSSSTSSRGAAITHCLSINYSTKPPIFTRQRYSFDENDQQPPLVRTVPPAWSFFLARVAWIIFESGTVDCNHLVIHQFVKGVATVPTFGTVDEILPSSFEDEILLLPLRFPRNVLTIFVLGELGEIPFVLLCWLS